jgi:hypothetical protein
MSEAASFLLAAEGGCRPFDTSLTSSGDLARPLLTNLRCRALPFGRLADKNRDSDRSGGLERILCLTARGDKLNMGTSRDVFGCIVLLTGTVVLVCVEQAFV